MPLVQLSGISLTSQAARQALAGGDTNHPPTPRQCGQCSLCCKVKSIVELRKPMGVWCRHAKPRCGCTIYETRPESCHDYACQWLIDLSVPDELQPSKCGFVMETHAERNRLLIVTDPDRPYPARIIQTVIDRCKAIGMVVAVVHKDLGSIHAPDRLLDDAVATFRRDNDEIQAKAAEIYGIE